MSWKKTIESQDLLVFEKEVNNAKLKIEARRAKHNWEVFFTKLGAQDSHLMAQYVVDNKAQMDKIIERLKNLKKLPRSKPIPKNINITIKRAYKEEFVEKWYFSVNREKEKNFIIVKFDTNITADVVLHESYRLFEHTIINQLEQKLGLEELGETNKYDIFYYGAKSKREFVNNFEYQIDYFDAEYED